MTSNRLITLLSFAKCKAFCTLTFQLCSNILVLLLQAYFKHCFYLYKILIFNSLNNSRHSHIKLFLYFLASLCIKIACYCAFVVQQTTGCPQSLPPLLAFTDQIPEPVDSTYAFFKSTIFILVPLLLLFFRITNSSFKIPFIPITFHP